jgi:hypothetical protein
MDQMRACVGRCNALDKEVSSLVAAGGGEGAPIVKLCAWVNINTSSPH